MALKLSFDVTTKRLVSYNGSAAALPPFGQCKTDVELRFVKPTSNSIPGLPAYEPIDLSAYLGPRLGIWTGSEFADDADADVLALTAHDAFTLNEDDADDPYYEGTLDTNTEEVAALDGKTVTAYLAVNLVRSADLGLETVFDQTGNANVTVYSATDEASGTLPIPALPDRRVITLPVYFRSEDGLREYVVTENGDQTGLLFTRFTPP